MFNRCLSTKYSTAIQLMSQNHEKNSGIQFFLKRWILAFVVLIGFGWGSQAHSQSSATWRVACNGAAHTDCLGKAWAADENFLNGSTFSTTSAITGALPCSTDQVLYQYERYGNGATPVTYVFDVPAGSYQVTLKFAEIYFTAVGDRVFNVSIAGTQVLTNFDIFAASGGENIAIDEVFSNIAPSGGAITILLGPASVNNGKCDAIQIVAQPTNTATNTATVTSTNTATKTATVTSTNTVTKTATNTATVTSTNTVTNSATNTPTVTSTNTVTNTSTNTATVTSTNTATNTATVTSTNTATNSATNTATVTSTNTVTKTATNTATVTSTNTVTNSATNTATVTSTNTATNSATHTATVTSTNTATNSATNTAT